MSKSVFRLPSNCDIEVCLHEPTVADCIEFSDLDENLSERSTTLFLNQVSSVESRDWTMQDRMTALWWTFVTTSTDTTLAYEYVCSQCNETHLTMIDLVDLDDEALSLMVPCFVDDEIQFNGVIKQIRIKPFDGWCAELLEQHYLHLKTFNEDTKEYKKVLAKIKVLEIALSFHFIDENGETEKHSLGQQEEKLNAISTMSRVNEFSELVAAITAANQHLRHGLRHTFKNGQMQLLSQPLINSCEADKEVTEPENIRLLIPFFSHYFIPQI